MLGRFIRSLVAVWVCYACFLGQSLFAAENASLDSLESQSIKDSAQLLNVFRLTLENEQKAAADYRTWMTKALLEDQFEDLRRIIKDAKQFEQNAKVYPVFYGNEKILLSYFAKNYDFLSNVDSIKAGSKEGRYYDVLQDVLYKKLKSEIESAKLEETLKQVENESDRAFIYIFIVGLFEKKETTTELIEKFKYQLTKQDQLRYLTENFWKKEDFDTQSYFAFSMGASVVQPLGNLCDRVKTGGGMLLGFDLVHKNYLFDLLIDINFMPLKRNPGVDPDSLQFSDGRLDFNFGYPFVIREKVKLYGVAAIGLGMNSYNDGKGDRDKNNLPYQFYPAFGAGVLLDLFFTKIEDSVSFSTNHHGIRFRAGFRSLFSGDVIKTSGVRLYAAIEWVMHEYSKAPVDFDYSFREKSKTSQK